MPTNEIIIIQQDKLVEQCKEGNEQAFKLVYSKYAKALLNSSFRVVGNLTDAEDLTQEAFLDGFKNIQNFIYKSSFEAWLRRIVINKSISFLRKKKINISNMDTAYLGNINEHETIDESEFDYKVTQVNAAINLLPLQYKIVFNLFIFDDLSQKEIAEILQIEHNHVRIIYYRAKHKILEMIKNKVV